MSVSMSLTYFVTGFGRLDQYFDTFVAVCLFLHSQNCTKNLKNQFFLGKLFCFLTDFGLQGGKMSVSMRYTRVQNLGSRFQLLPCRTKRCLLKKIRQNLYRWTYILWSSPLNVELSTPNFLCEFYALRRSFCRV